MKSAAIQQLEKRRLLSTSPQIDLTFGEGGVASVDSGAAQGFSVVEPISGGKILAAGGDVSRAVVARFNADGSPDTTFGTDGVLEMPKPFGAVIYSGAVAPDGGIVLAGGLVPQTNADIQFQFIRFDASGNLDTTFGTNGTKLLDMVGFHQPGLEDVAMDSAGRIVFGIDSRTSKGEDVDYLERLNADGSLDTGFRGGFTAPQATGFIGEDDLLIASSGQIYVAGGWLFQQDPNDVQGAVARFNSDGTVDSNYGINGIASVMDLSGTPDNPPVAEENRIALDKSGRIVVTSDQLENPDEDSLVLTRFKTDGRRDLSFGPANGQVEFSIPGDEQEERRVLVDSDGRMTLAVPDISNHVVLYRINPSGHLDATFGEQGKFEPTRDLLDIQTLALDGDGNLLAAGQSISPYFMSVARFTPTSPDVSLNSVGHLFVTGTDDADTISLEHQDVSLIVDRNGVTTSFNFSDVKQLTVFPSAGGDVITVPFALDCNIDGGGGNDTISVGDGDMTLTGGNGNDRITAGAGNHMVNLGAGNNRLRTGEGRDTVLGIGGDNVITTGDGSDCIQTGDGNDLITTGDGNDTIYTGNGNDTVYAGDGNDKVQAAPVEPIPDDDSPSPDFIGGTGGTGNKLYYGQNGDDQLYGGSGKDSLDGGAQNDSLFGGGGNDLLTGDGGRDSLVGSGGNDQLFGGDQPDRLFGGIGVDTLHGDGGNDYLDSGADNHDRLFGDGGDDTLLSEGTGATLDGSGGNDTILAHNNEPDVINGDGGHDTAQKDKLDTLTSIEAT